MAHYVQRGVHVIMAAKGAWDTARTIYGMASAAAPLHCRDNTIKKMRGFRSAFERMRHFTTNAFHQGRQALVHLDHGLTTAAHIYQPRGPDTRPARDSPHGSRAGTEGARLLHRGLRRLRQGARERAPGEQNGRRAAPRYKEKDAGTIKWIG